MSDFIDITPKAIGGKGKKGFVFQENEWDMIFNNPGGLTKEGLDEKIRIWGKSQNKYVQAIYNTMKLKCRDFAKSGKTQEGLIIYSRDKEGAARWVEPPKTQ